MAGVDAGNTVGGAKSPVAPVKAAAATPPVAAAVPFKCETCGRVSKNAGGHARHTKSCKRKALERAAIAQISAPPATPAKPVPADDPLPPPRAFDEWRTAAAGAAAAEAAVAGADNVVDVISRLEADKVGIPDLIALVCLRALPPPLTDSEYAMLRVAYQDQDVTIPPWLLTVVITLAVLGPRVAGHPVYGPWLREKLVGEPVAAVTSSPRPAPPPPPPIVTPPPVDPPPPAAAAETPADAAKQAIRLKLAEKGSP